jgi:CheY-like chemotaxis protein
MADKNKKQKKVILVEDNPAIIEIYTTAFKIAHINAEFITLGREAIERVKKIREGKEEKPGLVFIDLILSDINGIEILKEIKGNSKTKDITSFILSNYSPPDFQKTEQIKPDRFILKTSVTPTQLVKIVKEQLN